MAPWGPFECSDGWVALIVATERDWGRFCEAIGRPDLGRQRRRRRPAPSAPKNMTGWLGEIIAGWFRGPDEGRGRGEAAGRRACPSARCRTPARSSRTRTSRRGSMLIDVPDPILGSVRLVGPAFKMSGSPEPLARAAPLPRRAHRPGPRGDARLLRAAGRRAAGGRSPLSGDRRAKSWSSAPSAARSASSAGRSGTSRCPSSAAWSSRRRSGGPGSSRPTSRRSRPASTCPAPIARSRARC